YEYLPEPQRIAHDRDRSLTERDVELVLAALDCGAAGLDRALDDLREVDLTLVEQQLSARDAAHIEQLAHDALEVAALAVDCLTHRLEHRVTEPLLLHQHHGVADRSERIAQLVREHRDELVHPR